MKTFFLFFFAFFLFQLSAAGKTGTAEAKVQPLNGWTRQYRAARRNAKATGRLVIVLFTISDSPNPSNRRMIQLFRTGNFVRKANEDYVLMHADLPQNKHSESELMDQNRRLKGRFRITVFPSVILVDPKTPWGDFLYMRSGFLQPDELLSDLEERQASRLKKLRSARKNGNSTASPDKE